MQMIGGIVLGAAAVVAVIIAISVSSGGGGGLKHGTQASQTVTQVEQLLSGIPQSGTTLGNPNAPVTMTYYGDLECPVCQAFTVSGGFPQLVSNDIRAGRVKVVYRSFQTATHSPQTFLTQQVAALAAGKQNHFWDYAELFYHEQGEENSGYVNESYLNGLAEQIPSLNLNSWQSARSDSSLASQVKSDVQAGTAAGVQGTPTLIFQGPKGQISPTSAVPSYADLQQAIKSVT